VVAGSSRQNFVKWNLAVSYKISLRLSFLLRHASCPKTTRFPRFHRKVIQVCATFWLL